MRNCAKPSTTGCSTMRLCASTSRRSRSARLTGSSSCGGASLMNFLQRMAEDQVQGITGMSELHNDLVADNDLAATVSMVLALDSRTAGQHIGVYPRLGAMHLRGSVRTRAAYEGASNVARAVPSVTRIMNELRIDPDANEIPVLAGVHIARRWSLVAGSRPVALPLARGCLCAVCLRIDSVAMLAQPGKQLTHACRR